MISTSFSKNLTQRVNPYLIECLDSAYSFEALPAESGLPAFSFGGYGSICPEYRKRLDCIAHLREQGATLSLASLVASIDVAILRAKRLLLVRFPEWVLVDRICTALQTLFCYTYKLPFQL